MPAPILRRDCFRLAAAATLPSPAQSAPTPIDFRYAPLQWQTAYCFPDDAHKSLTDERGRLLYGNPGRRSFDFFPTIVEFSLLGMEDNHVLRQQLESPTVPIIHTFIERPEAKYELITFATNRASEGRVDNVLFRLATPSVPFLTIRTRGKLTVQGRQVTLDSAPLLAASRPLQLRDDGHSYRLTLPRETEGEILLRFPQAGQTVEAANGAALLEEARQWWQAWRPFGASVDWELPTPYNDFLRACARNILQAREQRDGRLTFQVGPTCYRGLWVVDGHFILEAARYLGYDAEARQGLQTTWTYQRPDGALDAGGGPEHFKDAAIAIFSTVRQCELSQDFTDFERLLPKINHAADFLQTRRDSSHAGLIVPGFADGGFLKGLEFTNTLWTLAGLQAAAQRPGTESLARFHRELLAGFETTARQEMVRHPAGFDYLPMVMHDDPAWQKNEWDRPRPQAAQWALSQAIYPGVVFPPSHPIVRGHLALMQWCTREDVPIETGWLPHGGLWTYNAGFAAHAYLWAGESDWARRTFHGFLNHSTPLYCWREEQPLRGSTVAGYIGDMPHNWASAECVLYLRHMLALEDGPALRLLAGIGAPELAARQPFRLRQTPTRFGRLDLELTPQGKSWQLKFHRTGGPVPAALRLPATLAGLKLKAVQGAQAKPAGPAIEIDPAAPTWSATWG